MCCSWSTRRATERPGSSRRRHAGVAAGRKGRHQEARRRAGLDNAIVSAESKETAEAAAGTASAQYQAALSARNLAELNLERTVVRRAVTGYVTNLNVHAGDLPPSAPPSWR
jgi:multidrug resistance efflux pump